ncbi:MAG: DUF4349 domain-containing protein [Deltaproteobacteria bacterium]|nr:DUF4349 domain-containing protein [Deltaproteobacteria bacterium]
MRLKSSFVSRILFRALFRALFQALFRALFRVTSRRQHMVLSSLALLVALPACASAEKRTSISSDYLQGNSDEYSEKAVIDFSDVNIEGELSKPNGQYIRAKRRISADSFELQALESKVAQAEPAPPGEPKAEPTKEEEAKKGQRKIIYTAMLDVMVANPEKSRTEALKVAQEMGGYLDKLSGNRITLRIPVERFEDFVAIARKSGRIVRQEIKADDVTQKTFELMARFKNAEHARERLLKLLDRGDNIEHVLKVEIELKRVTEEIEVLKGKLQYLQAATSMSTVILDYKSNAPAPHRYAQQSSPFPWMRNFGPESLYSRYLEPEPRPWFFRTGYEPPKAFLVVEEESDFLAAVTSSGARLRYARQLLNGGDLAFWSTALKDEFEKRRGYVLLSSEEIEAKGEAWQKMTFETTLEGNALQYQVLLHSSPAIFGGTTLRLIELLDDKATFATHAKAVLDDL